MAITMQEKFDSVILSKLPENFRVEFEGIKTDTKNFNPKYIPIEQENFDMLYDLIEKKHPEAIKKGGTLKKEKPAKVKKVKPKVEKKQMVHKSRGKKPEPKFKVGDTVFAFWNKNGTDVSKTKTSEFDIKREGEIVKIVWLKERSKYSYNVENHGFFFLAEESDLNLSTKEIEKPSEDGIDDCRKILNDAGYSTKKRVSKDGKKVMKVKAPREERVIIKEKVDGVFTTILKEISGSKEKDEKYSEIQKQLTEAQSLITKLFQMLNNLAEDNSTDKVEKIISLLKKIVP